MDEMFPIMEDHPRPRTYIPWWLAEIAYENYNCKSQQSLERIAERGGFGREELVALIRGGYQHL